MNTKHILLITQSKSAGYFQKYYAFYTFRLNKMVAILQTFSNHLLIKMFHILIQISLKFVRKGPIDNKTALVYVDGLMPNRCQAIAWSSADLVHF